MNVIGIDLGGTKVTGAIFDDKGTVIKKEFFFLEKRKGKEVGELIRSLIDNLMGYLGKEAGIVTAIGICVPGIADAKTGEVWAPNIPEWTNYRLQEELEKHVEQYDIKVYVASDRTCYILGERWIGQAKGCDNAVFFAVGTGIGLGILLDGNIVHGHADVVGAIGWMALQTPYREGYEECGCFETYASGEGIAKQARAMLKSNAPLYKESSLRRKNPEDVTSHDVFFAYMQKDPLAVHVLNKAIELWGMAAANVVSLFNPEKVIWGGGVFGPAQQFIDKIYDEACRWAQPISIKQAKFEYSLLSGDAGLYGAGYLALKSINEKL
ncbi:ROK family protein [Dysgonomonas sp. OttesenSCG-928-D17]|nr:ROK family protein [Dysgonomonas sp. OttesenSCG-928-D17]